LQIKKTGLIELVAILPLVESGGQRMTHDELLAQQVKNLHFVGISTKQNAESSNDVVDVTVNLKYFTSCCGEAHEQQDAVATVLLLLGGIK
jgi:hypothetical protein